MCIRVYGSLRCVRSGSCVSCSLWSVYSHTHTYGRAMSLVNLCVGKLLWVRRWIWMSEREHEWIKCHSHVTREMQYRISFVCIESSNWQWHTCTRHYLRLVSSISIRLIFNIWLLCACERVYVCMCRETSSNVDSMFDSLIVDAIRAANIAQ